MYYADVLTDMHLQEMFQQHVEKKAAGFPAKRRKYVSQRGGLPRARTRIDAILRKCPPLHILVRRIWTTCRLMVYWCKTRLAIFLNRGLKILDVDKTEWLSPEKIVYSSFEFDTHHFKGAVIGGDWDLLEERFEDLDVYVAFKEVLMEGKKWADTTFYRRTLDLVNRGEFPWDCESENDLHKRYKMLEGLFRTVKNSGYKSQAELLQSKRFADQVRRLSLLPKSSMVDDEININIGRHGDLLFNNSAHRLAIAKLLHIKEIPVKIAVRHPGWMLLRDELIQYARMKGGTLSQPATHPDLTDIPAYHVCEDKFHMIKDNMSARRGRLLDIGANLGYFCHRFEDEGFECYAVENSPRELHLLQKLRRAENRKFKIVAKSIYGWPQVGNTYFDVILALSTFHHALRTKASYQRLVTLLKNLQMREMFFELPPDNEPQMQSAYKNYTPSEFVEFIIRSSGLEQAQSIGKAPDGRELYRLS